MRTAEPFWARPVYSPDLILDFRPGGTFLDHDAPSAPVLSVAGWRMDWASYSLHFETLRVVITVSTRVSIIGIAARDNVCNVVLRFSSVQAFLLTELAYKVLGPERRSAGHATHTPASLRMEFANTIAYALASQLALL